MVPAIVGSVPILRTIMPGARKRIRLCAVAVRTID